MWLHVWLRVQLLVAAAACVAVEFLAVFERNVRKGLALHAERKPFGYLSVTPACAGLGSLVDDLLEQIGGCLGEGELAEARIHGGEVGVEDLVESVVLHVHSFSAALCLPFAAILFSLVSLCLDCRHVIPVAACHSD